MGKVWSLNKFMTENSPAEIINTAFFNSEFDKANEAQVVNSPTGFFNRISYRIIRPFYRHSLNLFLKLAIS